MQDRQYIFTRRHGLRGAYPPPQYFSRTTPTRFSTVRAFEAVLYILLLRRLKTTVRSPLDLHWTSTTLSFAFYKLPILYSVSLTALAAQRPWSLYIQPRLQSLRWLRCQKFDNSPPYSQPHQGQTQGPRQHQRLHIYK